MSTLAPSASPSARVAAPSTSDATALAVPPSASTEALAPAAIPSAPAIPALSVDAVLAHVHLVREVLARTMVAGRDYGRIPGCGDKPVLLKPGAELLCLTFRLCPSYQIEERALERGHREYRIVCSLSSMGSGTFVGQGVGASSTLEARCQRQGPGESTGRPVPRAYWDLRAEDAAKAQELLGGKGFSARKIEGQGWMICRGGGEKTEHDNPADLCNSTLKMGKKRALVDAVLSATAASSLFGQDLEEGRALGEPGSAVPESGAGPARLPAPPPARDVVEVSVEPSGVANVANVDWRMVEVPFGRNQGRTLAELSEEEVAFYVSRMRRREAAGTLAEGEAALTAGLLAHERWAARRRSPARA